MVVVVVEGVVVASSLDGSMHAMQIERGTGEDAKLPKSTSLPPACFVLQVVFGRVEPFLRHCCREDIEIAPSHGWETRDEERIERRVCCRRAFSILHSKSNNQQQAPPSMMDGENKT